MMSAEVIKLNQNEVYDQIERFFAKCRRRSVDTEVEYRKDIKVFFKVVRNVDDVRFLTREQIQVTLDDFEDFISYYEGKLANSTINRRNSSVKSLLRYLHSKPNFENRIVKDTSFFDQVETLKDNPNEYGVLDVTEVYEIAELLREEKDRGEEKYFAVLLSLDTSMRKSALLNLKWSDFVVKENEVFLIYLDKGKKEFRKKIGKEFYSELLSIKIEGQDKLFSLHERTLNKMMDRAIKKLELDKNDNRHLTWHSIRKASGTYDYRKYSDILRVQRMLGHSSPATTQKYLAKEEYSPLGAVSERGNFDDELYKKVDYDVLIQAIEGMSKSQVYLLNEEISKIQKR